MGQQEPQPSDFFVLPSRNSEAVVRGTQCVGNQGPGLSVVRSSGCVSGRSGQMQGCILPVSAMRSVVLRSRGPRSAATRSKVTYLILQRAPRRLHPRRYLQNVLLRPPLRHRPRSSSNWRRSAAAAAAARGAAAASAGKRVAEEIAATPEKGVGSSEVSPGEEPSAAKDSRAIRRKSRRWYSESEADLNGAMEVSNRRVLFNRSGSAGFCTPAAKTEAWRTIAESLP